MAGLGERYVDIHEVSRKVDLSTKTIRRKVRERQFPPPFRWAGGWRWLESEVDRWMLRNACRLEINPDDIPETDTSAEVRGQSGTSDKTDTGGTGKTKIGR